MLALNTWLTAATLKYSMKWHPTGACFPRKKGSTIPHGTWRKLKQPGPCARLRFGVSVTLLCHSWRQKKQEERGKGEVRLLCACNPWLER